MTTQFEKDLAMLLGDAASGSDDTDMGDLSGIENDGANDVMAEKPSGHDVVQEVEYSFVEGGFGPELREVFDDEAEGHLENISRQLNELSSTVIERIAVTVELREKLYSIRRSVHTLKGAAAVIGIESVAKWGHDFEDFLDNLHDESDTISPDSITAMQEGVDILELLALDPSVDMSAEIGSLQNRFPTIMAEGLSATEENVTKSVNQVQSRKSRGSHRKDAKKILRVDSEKVEELMGLSGDMFVNLKNLENSAVSMQSGLDEFGITMQRLRNIVSTLETGYKRNGGNGAIRDSQGGLEAFDSLGVDRYSDLQGILNSLNETVADLDVMREQNFITVQNSWQEAVSRQRRLVDETQGVVVSIQKTPFSTLSNRLYKTVRESAKATGKKVRLRIDGADLEMDTHIWNVLVDALMHLIRNCIDHGVESSKQRHLAGKPEQATIRINCLRQGNRFVLRLSDDGAGLDYDAIRRKAQVLYPGIDVTQMDEKELTDLIFKPGFSVCSEVSSMSGRGVGMDVVKNSLDQLDGIVEVHTSPGEGTEFVLSIPIAIA